MLHLIFSLSLVKHTGGRPYKSSSCWIWGVRSKSQWAKEPF